MSGDSLGDRMKGYENAFRHVLPRRMPVIVRVDGKAFHAYARACERPFDERLMRAMDEVALALCEEAQGAALAYVQSDEVSVLLHNYRRLESQAWLENGLQKVASISAATAAVTMTEAMSARALFDARVFVLPEAEVCNYFIWRQQDATRNSIQMVAQSLYSHKELHCKGTNAMQEMIWQKGQNWNDLASRYKRGRCAYRSEADASGRRAWKIDDDIPVFTQDRAFVEKHLAVEFA